MVTNTETYIKKTIVYYTSPTIIEKDGLILMTLRQLKASTIKIGKRFLIYGLVQIAAQGMVKFIQ